MSILVVQILSQGILFGADRNISFISTRRTSVGQTINIMGQSQRRKVLRWPNNKALIGYVGAATIANLPTDEWLYNFIGKNLNFQNFEELAIHLRNEVQMQRTIDEKDRDAEPLIIHLAGFEDRDSIKIPVVWYVRNSHRLDPVIGYADIRKDFAVSEELWKKEYIEDSIPQNIREFLDRRARNFQPFWFHQGVDLPPSIVPFVIRLF